jgi:membrane-bound lytic murein transglycosylase D
VTSRVMAGQQLMVPHETAALLVARADRPTPAAESRPVVAVNTVVSAPNSDRVKLIYRVKRGDTLASIARVFRTSVASLQRWNDISGSRISAGSRLTIYTARAN